MDVESRSARMSFQNVCTYKNTGVSSNWMWTLHQLDSNVDVCYFSLLKEYLSILIDRLFKT
jgi:hypothetical protein